MGRFNVIPQDTFNDLQLDAGILLTSFNPASPTITDANIVTATTGGISVSCVPTYSDMGEDIDNCPINTKELKHIDSWACSLSTTALGTTPEAIRFALGAADITAASSKIAPRASLDAGANGDFADLWWVGDRADGGLVAVKLINALSTGGFVLQTTKNGKGTITLEVTGHVSIADQSTPPIEFYSVDAPSA